jgi:hypothetical protein
MNHALRLRLCLRLDWDEIDAIRHAVATCVEVAYGSAELGDALSMVSSELLENAVKYGKSGEFVHLSLEELADGMRIVVTNPVEECSPHTDALRERVAWLDDFSEPRLAFAAALERAYRDARGGGLGLARIAHEGGCSLQCDTSSRGKVTVSARYRRQPHRASVEARSS